MTSYVGTCLKVSLNDRKSIDIVDVLNRSCLKEVIAMTG
jgi:hypothetical protein